jgi:tetratricopeptide (TPR) repeat protein
MQSYTETFSWFKVTDDVKKLLILAAQNWENTSESEKYINLALAKTDDSPDVLVAAYRYFFYKNNYEMALQIAGNVIDRIKEEENFPDDWEQLQQILVSRKEDPKIRLYLTAYNASGLVLAKLGQIEAAKKISSQVKDVDNTNEFGAAILLDVLTRPCEEDE